MKTAKLLMVLFAGLWSCLISCDTTNEGESETLSVKPNKIVLSAGIDSKEVTITASTGTWSAVRPETDSWCTLTTKDNKLTVAVSANDTDGERKTKITVTAGSATPVNIDVTQSASILATLPDSIKLVASGKEQVFVILTTEKITLSQPDPAAWCTVIITNNELRFSAPVNNDGVVRETIANITAGGETKAVVVTQEPKKDLGYSVGDAYIVDGVTKGMVGLVNDESGEIIVVSSDDYRDTDTSFPSWSFGIATSMLSFPTTTNDGQKNMELFRASPSKGDFRAFNFCEKMNASGAKDWFLPSKEELTALYESIEAFGLTKFNEKLVAAGCLSLSNSKYWTSTQGKFADYMWCISFANGAATEEYERDSEGRAVRAIRRL